MPGTASRSGPPLAGALAAALALDRERIVDFCCLKLVRRAIAGLSAPTETRNMQLTLNGINDLLVSLRSSGVLGS